MDVRAGVGWVGGAQDRDHQYAKCVTGKTPSTERLNFAVKTRQSGMDEKPQI